MTIYYDERVGLARDMADLVGKIRTHRPDLNTEATKILDRINQGLVERDRQYPPYVLPEPVAEVA